MATHASRRQALFLLCTAAFLAGCGVLTMPLHAFFATWMEDRVAVCYALSLPLAMATIVLPELLHRAALAEEYRRWWPRLFPAAGILGISLCVESPQRRFIVACVLYGLFALGLFAMFWMAKAADASGTAAAPLDGGSQHPTSARGHKGTDACRNG